MTTQRPRSASTDLLATTTDADAVAIRLDKRPRRPDHGAHRRVVAYCAPEVNPRRFASILRELADRLDET